MAYPKASTATARGRLGVRIPPTNATRFGGIPFIFVSKFGSKGSNSGTTDPRERWWKRYQDKNNARWNRRLSRNG